VRSTTRGGSRFARASPVRDHDLTPHLELEDRATGIGIPRDRSPLASEESAGSRSSAPRAQKALLPGLVEYRSCSSGADANVARRTAEEPIERLGSRRSPSSSAALLALPASARQALAFFLVVDETSRIDRQAGPVPDRADQPRSPW
jgi:hypothetical protein